MENRESLQPISREMEIYRASLAVLTDIVPPKVNAIFMHGRAQGDTDGIFEQVRDWILSGRAEKVVITGTEGDAVNPSAPKAWAGKTEWTAILLSMGVPQETILYSDPACHTRGESDQYLKLASQNGWERAIVLSQPHQALRAILGTLRSMQLAGNYPLRVYSGFPAGVDWNSIVHGSQGQHSMARINHCDLELQRVIAYQQKGDLVPFSEYIEYRLMRDSITS